jgi:hypothetical protein
MHPLTFVGTYLPIYLHTSDTYGRARCTVPAVLCGVMLLPPLQVLAEL